MKKNLIIAFSLSLFVACSGGKTDEASDTKAEPVIVKIDGSSTVYPISEAAAEDYKNENLRVTIGTSGTGGGFKKFINKEIDIANASRPIKPEEADACKVNNIQFIEIPIAYDGLAVVVNPKNDWVDKLTTAELKLIWEAAAQGKITSWSQVRKGFPDRPIRLFGPGTDSGTFDYFTEVIMNKKGDSRADYTASEDDNTLVQGVASDEGSLGYFGLAYYTENKDKLKLIPVDDGNDANGAGAITPTLETVQNGTYAPLSRVLFLYANTESETREGVKDFLVFYVQNAGKLSEEVGYIPLQSDLYTIVLDRLQKDVTGSLYPDGKEAGASLEQRLKGATASN